MLVLDTLNKTHWTLVTWCNTVIINTWPISALHCILSSSSHVPTLLILVTVRNHITHAMKLLSLLSLGLAAVTAKDFPAAPLSEQVSVSVYCQARVQVPNTLSQQAPNPDRKVRPSLKNPKTQFFGLGWHNNHKTTISTGSNTISTGSDTISTGCFLNCLLWVLPDYFQISNYSINYFNGGKYPLPQTLLVKFINN